MADNGDRSMLRRVHDATCPGAVANIKPVQRVCPVCRAVAKEEASAVAKEEASAAD